jgi:hypothetical protein
MNYTHILFILTYFHMYWRMSVLLDTYMKTMENVVKVRNQTKCKADSCKSLRERPTNLNNLGLKCKGTWPRPSNQPT